MKAVQTGLPRKGSTHYLLIGRGQLACHLRHYFQLLGLSLDEWNRDQSLPVLEQKLAVADRVLLAISDRALAEFFANFSSFAKKESLWIHFSGCHEFPGLWGAHPLMSFASPLKDLAFYQGIPFALTQQERSLNELLPGLPNDSFFVSPQQKPLYHALCSVSGNLTQLLWIRCKQEFAAQLGLSADLLDPYLKEVCEQLQGRKPESWSGPLRRGDQSTLERQLEALGHGDLQNIYQSFIDLYSGGLP